MEIIKDWFLLLGEDYVISMLLLTTYAAMLAMGLLSSKAYEATARKKEGANQKACAQWAIDTWSFSTVIANIPGVRLAIVLFYVLFLAYLIAVISNQAFSQTNLLEWGLVTGGAIISLLIATHQYHKTSARLKPLTD